MKVLVDVNVLLDVLLDRQPWVVDSRAVWDANHQRRVNGFIAATAVTNLFYVAQRLVGTPVALQAVHECLAAFDVAPVDRSVLSKAAMLPGDDFEDNVAICCAMSTGIGAIVTRDSSGFLQSAVPAITPAQLIAQLSTAQE